MQDLFNVNTLIFTLYGGGPSQKRESNEVGRYGELYVILTKNDELWRVHKIK